MSVFVDTSAWVALKDHADSHHFAATEFLRKLAGRRERLTTTDFILDETYTLLLYDVGFNVSVQFKAEIDQLLAAETLRLIHIGPTLQAEAWAIFQRFNRDKSWSFTDCSSYVVMRHEGITECFAVDQDFVQMGFTASPGSA